jgi:acyl-CoA thioesterase-1
MFMPSSHHDHRFWSRLGLIASTVVGVSACHSSSEAVAVGVPGGDAVEPSVQLPQTELGLPKVAFLGDSISAGLHLAAEQAFPAVLQRRLAASGGGFALVNAGVSGDTTAGGLRRVDWLLKQAPRILVVELGANDGMRGVPVETIEANLRAIIEKAQAAKVPVLLLGMRIPPSYGAEYVAAFEALFPRVAKDLQVAFVPFFMQGVAGIPELNLPDGIHPTPQGHEKLAQNLSGPLRELLEQTP